MFVLFFLLFSSSFFFFFFLQLHVIIYPVIYYIPIYRHLMFLFSSPLNGSSLFLFVYLCYILHPYLQGTWCSSVRFPFKRTEPFLVYILLLYITLLSTGRVMLFLFCSHLNGLNWPVGLLFCFVFTAIHYIYSPLLFIGPVMLLQFGSTLNGPTLL